MLMTDSVNARGGAWWMVRQVELLELSSGQFPGGDRTQGGPESITQVETMGAKDGKVGCVLLRAERTGGKMGEGMGPQ